MMKDFPKAVFFKMTTVGLQFLLTLVVSVWAGKSGWGDIALMVANSTLFLIVSSIGADASLVWHGASGKSTPREILGLAYFTILKQIFFYLLFSFMTLYFRNQLFLSNMKVEDGGYEFMFFFGLVLTDRYCSLFYSRQLNEVCNRLMTLITLFSLLLVTIFYLTDLELLYHPQKIYCSLVFLQAIALVLLFHLKIKSFKGILPLGSLRWSFYKFSIAVFTTNLIQFLAYRIDYWMVNFYKGSTELGIYSQACRFSQMLWFVPQAIASILMQTSLSLDERAAEVLIWRLLKTIIPLVLISTLPFTLIVYFLYRSWLVDFDSGLMSFLILLPGSALFCISILTASFFSAKRMLKINLFISSFCMLFISILDAMLIPKWGVNGAAIASSMGYGISGVFSLMFFFRTSITKYKEVSTEGFLKSLLSGLKWSVK